LKEQNQRYGDSDRLRMSIIVIVSVLTGIGLIAIYAASSLKGAQQFGDEYLFFKKQCIVAAIGAFIMVFSQKLPFHWIERSVLPILGMTLFLLLLVFIPGAYVKVGGASRWLNLPFIAGQPSELAKLALVLFLAKNLSRPKFTAAHFVFGVLPNLAVLMLLTGLLLVQKDLGTPVLLFLITFTMLFAAGITRRVLVLSGLLFIFCLVVAVIIEPYRISRILSFLDPWSQIKGRGFQIIQSFLAFQNGGFFGVGLGESKQKLFFLPEAHTDFILAVIGEELGLFGVLVVTLGFYLFFKTGIKIASQQRDAFRKFLAFGLTLTITVQACFNMGVCMGLLPTKGMTLPFLSSGNSSLLVFFVFSAILARLARIEDAKTHGYKI